MVRLQTRNNNCKTVRLLPGRLPPWPDQRTHGESSFHAVSSRSPLCHSSRFTRRPAARQRVVSEPETEPPPLSAVGGSTGTRRSRKLALHLNLREVSANGRRLAFTSTREECQATVGDWPSPRPERWQSGNWRR